MKHLSIRVAWHENKWNGTVCKNPIGNTFCTCLPRIYDTKKITEEQIANKSWSEIENNLPPCFAENGAFMNEKPWKRTFKHVYSKNDSHNHLRPTTYDTPEYTAWSVPFWWPLVKNQQTIDELYPDLPANYPTAPFSSAWVYSDKRQIALNKLFFEQLTAGSSLVFFYSKSGNPVDENTQRLLVGVGEISSISDMLEYERSQGANYPIWERKISHTIRPFDTSYQGILIPYHEYLEPTENGTLDNIRLKQLNEIKIILIEPDAEEGNKVFSEFSYGSELVDNETALILLNKLRLSVETMRGHGLLHANWDKYLEWINNKIGEIKRLRGAFPGLGAAIEAFGFKYGHLLASDLVKEKLISSDINPWTIIDELFTGKKFIKNKNYSNDFAALRPLWIGLKPEKRDLLELLSRFSINSIQAKRWFSDDYLSQIRTNPNDILNNPYIIAEEDTPYENFPAISIERIDMGVFYEKAIHGVHEPKETYAIHSVFDKRRIRALAVKLLNISATQGDTLLSIKEVAQRISKLKIYKNIEITEDYFIAPEHKIFFESKFKYFDIKDTTVIQLNIYNEIETKLDKIFKARAIRPLPQLNENWESLIKETIKGIFDAENDTHKRALADQVEALKKLTSRKISVLVGPAGTGKTSVMGALLRSQELKAKGILLLAPTGKARVKLASMGENEQSAQTIAQFLTRQNRFDWAQMKPRFWGKEKYKIEKTIVIDECSMLTEDDLYALFEALDLSHVERIIMVGDPFQLPPIGAGRPFADLYGYLKIPSDCSDEVRKSASQCLAELEVVVRSVRGDYSDSLLLASWFSGENKNPDSENILEKIEKKTLNDLSITYWKEPEELEELLLNSLKTELGLENTSDYKNFNLRIGISGYNFDYSKPENAEYFQILTPVRTPVWGVLNLNRLVQQQFRKRTYQNLSLGDQKITRFDKVMQLVNQRRDGYDIANNISVENIQLSNGQIGVVTSDKNGWANVAFSGLKNKTVGYSSKDFKEDGSVLELAYAITIHKSQGSDFKKVFLIIPKTGIILSRELIYTALTRSKERLVLLVQDDIKEVLKLSAPSKSETARRNTNLFIGSARPELTEELYAEHLIHKTEKPGLIVRSKSEVIIANMLYRENIEFEYEREFIGEIVPGRKIPDFSFVDAGGELILWEHLGMLNNHDYKQKWEAKRAFYEQNGYVIGQNLFVTQDDEKGGIDSTEIRTVVELIKNLI